MLSALTGTFWTGHVHYPGPPSARRDSLLSLGGHRSLGHPSLTGPARLPALAASPGQALVCRYFSSGEFAALNPGAYHNPDHPVLVAEVVGELARPERVRFLQQVALIHDADERLDPVTGRAGEGVSPARVQVTLEWMARNQTVLSQRFGWSALEFAEALAVIARTDFPFDDLPRQYGTRYDGQSPVQVYAELLRRLPAECRGRVMHEGLLLRFADQVANYTINPQVSEYFIAGLAAELRWPEVRTTTAAFLEAAGSDLEHDRRLAGELGVPIRLVSARQLRERLPARRRAALRASQEWFRSA